MNKNNIFLFILFSQLLKATPFDSLSFVGVGCNHHCIECLHLMPKVELSAKKLKLFYLKKEKELSLYYNTQITPRLRVREKLLKEIEKTNLEIKMIEYQNNILIKDIAHQFKNKKTRK